MTDTEPNPWETLHILSAAVTDATRRVERDSDLNEKRIQASVQKMRWFRRAAVIGVLTSLIGLWAGVQANQAVNELRDQRRASRIVQCRNEVATATRINSLNERTQQLLRNAVAGGDRTAEQDARAQTFLAAELAEYEKIKVPLRACDPASVERFYSNK